MNKNAYDLNEYALKPSFWIKNTLKPIKKHIKTNKNQIYEKNDGFLLSSNHGFNQMVQTIQPCSILFQYIL